MVPGDVYRPVAPPIMGRMPDRSGAAFGEPGDGRSFRGRGRAVLFYRGDLSGLLEEFVPAVYILILVQYHRDRLYGVGKGTEEAPVPPLYPAGWAVAGLWMNGMERWCGMDGMGV